MSARTQILASVRGALADATSPPAAPRGYRNASVAEHLLDLFIGRVEDYRATVHRCHPGQVETTISTVLGGRRAVVPPALPWHVPGAVTDQGQTPAELDQLDAVVTAAAVGIATTGTIVLDHRPDQGRRALSLVPDLHVCVIRADQVLPAVPDAIARLDPSRPLTWISGPSATSDIELSRVEGVHGPRTLHVILVEP